jgi:hypothetical protein
MYPLIHVLPALGDQQAKSIIPPESGLLKAPKNFVRFIKERPFVNIIHLSLWLPSGNVGFLTDYYGKIDIVIKTRAPVLIRSDLVLYARSAFLRGKNYMLLPGLNQDNSSW